MFGTNTSQKQTANPSSVQSFLEILKDKKVPGDFPMPFANPFEAVNQKDVIKKRRVEEFFRARQSEWQSVYSAKEQRQKKTIEEIREQLAKLAKELGKLNKEVSAATFAPIHKPGIYHQTFFDHIREIIKTLRAEVQNANSWISLYQKRSKQKGFYWNQVSKSGSSFMLNNERAVATSVG